MNKIITPTQEDFLKARQEQIQEKEWQTVERFAESALSFTGVEKCSKVLEGLKVMGFDPLKPYNPSLRGYYGTPLQNYLEAATVYGRGDCDMLNALLQTGIHPDQCTLEGFPTPFMVAVTNLYWPVVETLSNHGASWTRSISEEAQKQGSFEKGMTPFYQLMKQGPRSKDREDKGVYPRWSKHCESAVAEVSKGTHKEKTLSIGLAHLSQFMSADDQKECIHKAIELLKNHGADPLYKNSAAMSEDALPKGANALQLAVVALAYQSDFQPEYSDVLEALSAAWPKAFEDASAKVGAALGYAMTECNKNALLSSDQSFHISEGTFKKSLLPYLVHQNPLDRITDHGLNYSLASGWGSFANTMLVSKKHFDKMVNALQSFLDLSAPHQDGWDWSEIAKELGRGASSQAIVHIPGGMIERHCLLTPEEIKKTMSCLRRVLSLHKSWGAHSKEGFKSFLLGLCDHQGIKSIGNQRKEVKEGFTEYAQTLLKHLDDAVDKQWIDAAERKIYASFLGHAAQVLLKEKQSPQRVAQLEEILFNIVSLSDEAPSPEAKKSSALRV